MRKKYWMSTALSLVAMFLLQLELFAQNEIPDLHGKAQELKQQGVDVVGWIQVPGTPVDVAVVQADDNTYYIRRDIDKKYSQSGCVFADFRCLFEGGRVGCANTVLYANSFTDDPEAAEAVLFDFLKRYRDAEFAEAHPVLYFADTEETMVWQVFAVSVVSTDLPYNDPDPEGGVTGIVKEVRGASLHPFEGVTVSEGDRLLTLSTVDYSGEDASQPSRFVVMAKQVDREEAPDSEPEEDWDEAVSYNPDTGLPRLMEWIWLWTVAKAA